MFACEFGFACRQLRRSSGFAVTAVLTLGLGLGSTTAIFSLIEGILLRPLPFRDPARLVIVGDHLKRGSGISVTAREIDSYARQSSAFSSVSGHFSASYELSGGESPEQIRAERVTANVFQTLGVEPLMGRVFSSIEERRGDPLAVLSYGTWTSRFNRDAHVLGRTIELDRRTYTVIGVMHRSFEFPLQAGQLDRVQLWVPLNLTVEELSDENAGRWGYNIVARLKDGVTVGQASRDADRVAQQIMRAFPPSMAALHIQGDVMPLRESLVADARPLLRALFGAVLIVLLIACVNVASLSLVRAIRRRREYAIRLALGAGVAVILRESVFEGLIVGIAGGVTGLAFASIAVPAAVHLLPESIPLVDAIRIDGWVAGFALLLSLVTGGLCSLAPAFAAIKANLVQSLKGGSRNETEGASHAWLRSSLVVAEIAVALVMLIMSGAFLQSFQKMLAIDPGYKADHVLVAGYELPLRQYSTYRSVAEFNHAVKDKLTMKPGVLSVGLSNSLPVTEPYGESAYTIEGDTRGPWKLKFAPFELVQGEYFAAMGIRLLEGRTFTPDDRADSMPVIVVNESMAKVCWPGQRAIGKRMHAGNPRKTQMPWATVIGVVADTKLGSRDQPGVEQWYSTSDQPEVLDGPKESGRLNSAAGGFIAMRSELPPEEMIKTLRASVAEVDPLLALQQVEPMSDAVEKLDAPRRFNTGLITVFAIGALLLAITGIYAVVSFSVSVRVQEIAIRMAMGAQRAVIARLVLISALKMALAGSLAGVLTSIALSRLVASLLFEATATDPLIYLICVLLMVLVSVMASIIPATRAASTDPIRALRSI